MIWYKLTLSLFALSHVLEPVVGGGWSRGGTRLTAEQSQSVDAATTTCRRLTCIGSDESEQPTKKEKDGTSKSVHKKKVR
ncbi:hypothetical protein KQX54_008265 [Cotesia glomerata]|uniref:Secreted protein n=1 Tax=Cotesia glomerata TaxID=32391 RepID=A0AAV7HVV5_COTGL|nr:hypothetical protein KQX54_008265 [Cotesia glomerata]